MNFKKKMKIKLKYQLEKLKELLEEIQNPTEIWSMFPCNEKGKFDEEDFAFLRGQISAIEITLKYFFGE